MPKLKHRERLEVRRPEDDEPITVWNFLNVMPAYQFRGGNPTQEMFPTVTEIRAGGCPDKMVDYITSWVADEVYYELGIDNFEERYDIEVVEIEDDDVTVL